jgi:hypothetical protein
MLGSVGKGFAMKWNKLFTALVLLFAPICFGQVAADTANGKPVPANPSFSITVDPPGAPIHPRSPINVTITVTNITDKEIWWSHGREEDSVYRAFALLLMKDGREVETTIFDRTITDRLRPDDPPVDPGSGSSILLPYPPGKMFVMTIDLTKLYEITEPGTYTLNVRRIENHNKTIVRAKPLTLDIVP